MAPAVRPAKTGDRIREAFFGIGHGVDGQLVDGHELELVVASPTHRLALSRRYRWMASTASWASSVLVMPQGAWNTAVSIVNGCGGSW